MLFNNDDEMASKRFEQILKILLSEDKEALRALFSTRALQEAKQINEYIDSIFILFQGDILSWGKAGGVIVDQSFRSGDRLKEVKSFFTIDINEQNHIIFILDYTEDTANSENVGLYTLRIIKEEERETEWGFWQDMVLPGIYIP